MYLKGICHSSFPQIQTTVISYQDHYGPNWSPYIYSCSLIIHSPPGKQRKSGSATLLLKILHWLHIAFPMKSKSLTRAYTVSHDLTSTCLSSLISLPLSLLTCRNTFQLSLQGFYTCCSFLLEFSSHGLLRITSDLLHLTLHAASFSLGRKVFRV